MKNSNKTLSFLLFALFFFTGGVFAQTQFQRTIGGSTNDFPYNIIRTSDGGYAVTGFTNSYGAGSNDVYILKIDTVGALQWTKTFGASGDDEGVSVIQTTDGGYAIAGLTNSFGAGGYDMYCIKIDAGGNLQWNKTIGGSAFEEAISIVQTTDGGFAIAGTTQSFGAGGYDIYVVKLNASGSLVWSKTIGGTGIDVAWSIVRTPDGGLAVGGFIQNFGAGGIDLYIAKLDGGGNIQWNRTVGGANADYAYSMIRTSDGGYAMTGITNSFGAGGADMYIVKLDSSGTLQWTRTVGGTNSDYANNSIIQTTDGGFAIAGATQSFGLGGNDCYIVKLGAGGSLQWSKTLGGSGTDQAWSISQSMDGGLVAACNSNTFGQGGDIFLVKLDGSGNTCGNTTSPPSSSGNGGTTNNPTPQVSFPASTIIPQSPQISSGGQSLILCVLTGIEPVSNEIPSSFELLQNYPNPFNPATNIKYSIPKTSFVTLKVFDLLGSEVMTLVNEQMNPGNYEIQWNASNNPSGVYFCKLSTDGFTETKKMFLVK